MERLDKLLAGTGKWSRREVKALVRQGLVRVDGRLAASAEDKLDPAAAIITVAGETISLCRFTYVMLHKPPHRHRGQKAAHGPGPFAAGAAPHWSCPGGPAGQGHGGLAVADQRRRTGPPAAES